MRNPESQIVQFVAAIRSHDDHALVRIAPDIDIDAYDSEWKTPLIHAAACGNTVAVDFLLRHGADPLRANGAGTESPFLIGILRRDAVITRLLLDSGRLAARSRHREFRYDNDAVFLERDTARLLRLVREGLDPNTSWHRSPGVTLLSLFLQRRDVFAVSTVIQ